MSESASHMRTKARATGKNGHTEHKLKDGRRVDAVTKTKATEVERSGTTAGLQAAASRLKTSRKSQKVLQVPQKDMNKAVKAMRTVGVGGTVKNLGGHKTAVCGQANEVSRGLAKRAMRQMQSFTDERLAWFCAYCGGFPDTRDHVPSKILLDKPYPENLPVVPCCEKCNKSFSQDELYVATLLECVVAGNTDPDLSERLKIRNALEHSPALRKKLELARYEEDDRPVFVVENNRIESVVRKLAIGHLAFENGTFYYEPPGSVDIEPLPSMSQQEIEEFMRLPRQEAWPEAGSRAMTKMAQTWPEHPGWTLVQKDRYQYMVSFASVTEVRFLLRGYLACCLVW